MPIKSIYTKYFQKSKMFLYPLLGIKRGSRIVPSETYLAWNPTYKPEDMKLICLYHPDKKNDFKSYEEKVLLKHTRLYEIHNVNKTDKIFVFDFSDMKTDWDYFISGKFSMMEQSTKGSICSFFDHNSANYFYMKSYLYPDKYFEDYADILNVDTDMLKSVGELCNKPDIEKETFTLMEHLQNTEIIN